MLNVVCWKWRQPNYHTQFDSLHVITLRNMVKRNLSIDHRFLCITDSTKGLSDIETIPLWAFDNPRVRYNKPNCYKRLRIFSEEMKELIGEKILSIDLDVVITNDFTNLVDNDDDFIIWGDTAKNTPYNGSLFLMKTGSRKQVWETFTKDAPSITCNMVGSDQAWISHVLGSNERKFSTQDGIYSFKCHLNYGAISPPENCKMVFFHGNVNPWDTKLEWVLENYN